MTSLPAVALIVAAGRGTRMGGEVPKQFLDLCGQPALSRALGAFLCHPMVSGAVIVIHPDDRAHAKDAVSRAANPEAKPVTLAEGGATRQQSVAAGLDALSVAEDALVLIHDAARPFVSESLITRAISAGLRHDAAVPVLPVVDTIVTVDAAGLQTGTADRTSLRAVQTPQVFRLGAIRAAHAAVVQTGRDDFTDDAGVIRAQGGVVATFAGCPNAFKLTTPEDVARADSALRRNLTDIRAATGYDVHQFGPGDHIMLGGVRIAHDQGVVGHSDADVLLHALTDALLGAIGDGDIGIHFPPSDMRWKGAASRVFLAEAVRRVKARGGEIRCLDGTVVCEAPRIGPHREAIRALISEVAGIDISRVGLKATTSEKMGFTGRREGIAALATATIALPEV
ncbi:MAG: bifunctional 2-C-methyl-D-erythritol 4-phosphate cytidylyltransferase/2-C-methyl-D-erythritol 2,4-cyclodiphosphate synthase [Proteobacteria bacterium]|nr:bifunctional 2-C-methyl-D-erythritol 4-phosphate cytidylyltransferase/2-C-methyl-D-erythritol 2,4-cyclodiphosphate synthase [Pseudomonadota bacterium]